MISSLDGYIAATKQRIPWIKTASMTTVAAIPFSPFAQAGNPGAGTLAIGETSAGVVPTDATAGYPSINAFGGGCVGYLSKVEFACTVACRLLLFDRLYAAGAFAFNAAASLTAQPSFASRVPGGNDFRGLEIWMEAVTAFTGNPSIAVTYTDQSGNPGHTTGTIATGAALTVGRCVQLPLAAGDSGVQKIESVTATVASAGTFNVMVLRPLWTGRVGVANAGDVHDLLRTGMPQVFDNSALYCLVQADSTASGIPELVLEIANG